MSGTIKGGDSIQIRPMAYVTLTIDHRALDVYQANRFM
ncbi:2-oxo acid dehydrogenase subunit E2 [Sedimenticola selenatireducens]